MPFSFALFSFQPVAFRLVLLGLLLCGWNAASAAQAMPVPDKAWETQRKLYPNAEASEWAEQEDGYVVSFYDPMEQQAVSMRFDAKGRWLETLISIPTSRLLASIQAYLSNRFEEQFYATAFETRQRKNKHFYNVVVDTPTHLFTLTFNAKGVLLEEYSEGIDGD